MHGCQGTTPVALPHRQDQFTPDRISALVGAVALAIAAWPHLVDALPMATAPGGRSQAADESRASGTGPGFATASGREVSFGGYSGASYTHPSEVRVNAPGKVDLTAKDFGWIGMPFKSPIYYGLRTQHWSSPGAAVGAMFDFTHAKAIARADDVATFTGTRDGRPVAPKARIGDVFKHLEFSHGHNLLTLNGLFRMPALLPRVRPYLGAGAGIALPHTEIGFRDQKERTYEYQFAGFVGQALVGLEIELGRTSVFLEYKFTVAPYDVPLSHEPYGWVLVTDLWRQAKAWWRNEPPPGGRLSTTLATHHGIAGAMVRLGSPVPTGR
jgi:lipid A oxidase